MKFSVNREQFLSALQTVSGAIPSRSPRPILQDVKLVVEKDKLELLGTDTEVGIRYVMEIPKTKESAAVCIPASRLKDIVTELQDEKIDIDISGTIVHVLAKGRDFKINGDNSDEYPEIPAFQDKDAIELERDIFQTMIRKTVFATAKEQIRFTLNGVYMVFSKDKIEMAATDRRRLAVVKQKVKKLDKKQEPIIVPTKALSLTERILGAGPEQFSMNITDTRVLIKSGQAELIALLIEGNFPNYQEVVPKSMPTKIDLDKGMLAHVIKQARLLTSEETRAVNIEFSNGKMKVTSRSSEAGEAEITEELDYQGDTVSISFNPDFILDVLKVCDSDKITLELKDSSAAGMLKEGSDFFCVIMPIKPQE